MLSIAVVVLATAGTGGCAGTDQIEFQGRIFEMAGLTNRDKKEKVPEERAPLVVPPSKQLPEPGSRQAAASPQNWPVDPDEVNKQKEAEEKKRLEEYYKNGDFTDRAGIEEFEYFTNQRSRRPGMASKTANEIIETGRERAAAEEAERKKAAAEEAARRKTADAAGDEDQDASDDSGWNTQTQTVDPGASPPIQLPPSH